MYWDNTVFWIFICNILTVLGRRDLFNTKCKRKCNTQEGSLNCWATTRDGFAYGLSTSMIDYCQVILKMRDTINDKNSWYNISRDILGQQIKQYKLDEEVKQLTKDNIEEIAVSLLDKCFNAPSSTTSFEPPCPSCSSTQTKQINQWRLSSIVFASIALLLVFITLLMYTLHTYRIRRSYILI